MSRKLIQFTAALLFTVLFLASYLSMLSAQTPPSAEPAQITVYGTIQSMNANGIVLNGQIIDTTGAQIDAPLQTGMVIQVDIIVTADGLLSAQRVIPQPVGVLPGVVVIEGTADNVQADGRFEIGGQTITMLDTAQSIASGDTVRVFAVQDSPTRANQWTGLAVVRLDAIPAPVGTVEAAPPAATVDAAPSTPAQPPATTPEVVPPAATPEVSEDFRIEGTITAMNGTTIIVEGQNINIQNARIDDPLSVGAFVRVEARRINGVIIAEEVDLRD